MKLQGIKKTINKILQNFEIAQISNTNEIKLPLVYLNRKEK